MEHDPGQAKALLREARAGAATSLAELRELVKGISPPRSHRAGRRGIAVGVEDNGRAGPVCVPAVSSTDCTARWRSSTARVRSSARQAAPSGPETPDALLKWRPDVAIVDVRMPPTQSDEGLRAALAARREVPGLPVLILPRTPNSSTPANYRATVPGASATS